MIFHFASCVDMMLRDFTLFDLIHFDIFCPGGLPSGLPQHGFMKTVLASCERILGSLIMLLATW
jgi:hypothetical protein